MSSSEAWSIQARAIQEAGYATLLLRDHFIPETFGGEQFAPLIALMAAASATTTLRVGSLVLANDFRHPVLLAKEAATLDLLSGGRFELGISAGWLKAEYQQAGMPFDPPGKRVSRLEEALQVLKGLLAEDPLDFSGAHYTVTQLKGFPRPTQRPHPPLLVSAAGKRMLTLAAREADIIGLQTAAIADGVATDDPTVRLATRVAQQVEWVRQAAGERLAEVELNMVIVPIITPDRQHGAENFARQHGWSGVSVQQILEMPSVFIGEVEQIAEEMYARRERYGLSYYVVADRDVEAFAPVVAQLRDK
jgi:probable F420-dependent oxidoreductase